MNNVETQIVPNDPASGYWDIEIDPDPTIGPRIWYTVYALGEIRSAKFDGSDVQVELSGLSNPYGLALELELDEPPLASAGNDQTDECTGPDGAQVTLDGSGSTDPDSTAGTNDDIVLFEWIEDFGLPSEVLLGTGETLVTTLALGSHAITLRVTDSAGDQDTDTLTASVVDTTPPTLSISLTPMVLWPPNHHMATIGAVVTADDACGGPVVSLTSVTSDEPDNASGAGDGNTTNDIQGVDIGTPDAEFELRAERAGTGDGRTYTAVYSASDGSGNVGSDSGLIFVPHDQGGATEPVSVTVANKPDGLALEWNDVAGAFYYNVIRGDLANLHEAQNAIDLGVVTCVQEQAVEAGASGLDSDVSPEPGQVFFYLVEYFDGWNHCGYGTESVPKPRMPNAGDCE
jgi:hypothetical protein